MRKPAAAEYCGVSLRTLETWIAEELVPVHRPPGSRMVLLHRDALDRALAGWRRSAQVVGMTGRAR